MERKEVNLLIRITSTYGQAKYLRDEFMAIHGPNWTTAMNLTSTNGTRYIQWVPMDSAGNRLCGIEAVVIIEETCGRGIYFKSRYMSLLERIRWMNSRYCHG